MAKLVRIPSHPPNICTKLPHNINKASQSDSVPKHLNTKFTNLLIRQEQQHQFTNQQPLNSPNFQITINNHTSNASNSNSHTPAPSGNKSNDPPPLPIIPTAIIHNKPAPHSNPNIRERRNRRMETNLHLAKVGTLGRRTRRRRRAPPPDDVSGACGSGFRSGNYGARFGRCSWVRRRERGEGGQICSR